MRKQKIQQLEFRLRTWGGKRKGAGGKRVAPRPRVPHRRRPLAKRAHPVLVTVRVAEGVPCLRQPQAWEAIVRLVRKARGRFGMRVVEYSVLTNHLHMIVECDDPDSLERGMRGFNTRLAKQLNKLFERTGKLVDGRYHARALESPREVRNAIRYVLFNRAKHEARVGRRPTPGIDPRSTAARFDGWHSPPATPNRTKNYGTSPACTWLLKTGWRRHGLLALDEGPGPSLDAGGDVSRSSTLASRDNRV
jgi:REP element-mobilizing transposase RayT